MGLDLKIWQGKKSTRLYRNYDDFDIINTLKAYMVDVDPETKPDDYPWQSWPTNPYGEPIKAITVGRFKTVIPKLSTPGNQQVLDLLLGGVPDDEFLILVWH